MTRGALGPFELLEPPRVGTLTVVSRCREPGTGRDVAVKSARTPAGDADRALLHEARVRAGVEHPAVLALYRVEHVGGSPLLVGPWMRGGTLADLAPQPLRLIDTLAIGRDVAAGIDALHRAGWMHGDLSPANVLLSRVPGAGAEPLRAVLCDLGSARRLGARPSHGEIALTPSVAAPELWRGEPASGLSDVYALGALLFRCLTGGFPFEGDDHEAVRALHLGGSLPAMSALRAIGPATERAVLAALQKDPRRRPASGARLLDALRRALVADEALPARAVRAADAAGAAGAGGAGDAVDAGGAAGAGDAGGPHAGAGARQRAGGPPRPAGAAAVNGSREGAVLAAGERLEAFAATLDPGERRALQLLLRASTELPASGIMTAARMALEILGPAEALLCLEELGIARALAQRPRTGDECAAACELDRGATHLLLTLLATMGVLVRSGERFALPADLAALYRHQLALGAPARPLAAARGFWARLPAWIAAGSAAADGRDDDGAGYRRSVDSLDAAFGAAAAELAALLAQRGCVQAGTAILDIGAGSGVWSIAAARIAEGARITALDRALVLDRTHAFAAAAGLADRTTLVAGDWRTTPLDAGAYGLVFLANACHLEAEPEAALLVRRAGEAVSEHGTLAIVDTMPARRDGDAASVLQAMQLGLRTAGGTIHELSAYERWVRDAGLPASEALRLDGGLTALLARRPTRA